MEEGKKVAIPELKILLFELKERRPDICIRFRLLGEMWRQEFMRVIGLDHSEVLFFNEINEGIMRVRPIQNIIQFELDKSFQDFHAHFHYDVVLFSDSDKVSVIRATHPPLE